MRPTSFRLFPKLESLDDRLVPSATLVDLTSKGASAAAGDAIVTQVAPQPTGTGYIRSFVRVQGPASGGSTEHGYNTDARPLQFDENSSPVFTRHITVADVPVVTQNGVKYREFLLDINQKSSASKLSMDEFRIFVGDQPNLKGYDAATKTLAGKSAIFDVDSKGDVSVVLDARLNNGSGSGDMTILVPDAAFTGTTLGTYVYLYSKFGGVHSANGGFEEWAVKSGTPVAPPTEQTGSLSGHVYFDGDGTGIVGQNMQLQGVDDNGNNVTLTTQITSDGSYTFTGLAPGTYTIIFNIDGFDAYFETAGTLGGDAEDNKIGNIDVSDGDVGLGYDFDLRVPA